MERGGNMTENYLRAPFSYFGGKSMIAHKIWERLGDVENYIEPFFGSGAVLLNRPTMPKTETINDYDHFIANFWRAIQADPDAVAASIDYPVIEDDLHARHYWLVTEGKKRLAKLQGDPLGFDAKVAGWWAWGMRLHFGDSWGAGNGSWC